MTTFYGFNLDLVQLIVSPGPNEDWIRMELQSNHQYNPFFLVCIFDSRHYEAHDSNIRFKLAHTTATHAVHHSEVKCIKQFPL